MCWKLCFLEIIQNSIQHDILPNEKSTIQHVVLFTSGENSALEKFACVHRKKSKKSKKKTKQLVVTSETVKNSSGRNRRAVKDAEEIHTNYMALITTCDITHPD